MRINNLNWLKAGLFIVLASWSLGLAQTSGVTTGAIVGQIKDAQGALITGATVRARNIKTNATITVAASEQGVYKFLLLPPSEYEIQATSTAFAPQTERIILNIGVTALLDIILPVAANASYIVEVNESNVVNEGKTETSTNINSQTITRLPINQRNFLDFAMTTARVTRDSLPVQGVVMTSNLSVNGQSARNNNITIDGLSNNAVANGGVQANFSQEAVEEFQVITDSYSVEFGRSAAGAINIVTKSGSNNFHSNIFSFTRNAAISARSPFTITKPKFEQYQFGATLGGPIKPDKAFFFTSFERLSLKQNNTVTITEQTKAAAQRQGFPVSNGSIPFAIGGTTLLARVDLIVSPQDTSWLRYNGDFLYNGAGETFGGLMDQSVGGQLKNKKYFLAFSNTYYLPNNNLANETRFIINHNENRFSPRGEFPLIQLVAPEGQVSFGENALLPQKSNVNTVQFVNTVTLTGNKQTWKVGVDYFHAHSPSNSVSLTQFLGGAYFFGPINFSNLTGIPNLPMFNGLELFDPSLRTPAQRAFLISLAGRASTLFPGFPQGVPLADLALPTTFTQGFGQPNYKINANLTSLFVQNEYKLSPNFILKAGLRYDIERVNELPNNNGRLSPRIAIAYAPAKLAKLRVHAAYGIFSGLPFGGASAFAQNFQQDFKILVLPPPFSALPFMLSQRRFPLSPSLPQGVKFIPQLSLSGQLDRHFSGPYSQQTSLGIDYRLNNHTLISVNYIFVRGLKLPETRDINPVVHPIPTNPVQSLITGRIDPTKGYVFEISSAFDSYYHGLTLSLNQRLLERLALLASYTYAKAIDNVSDVSPDLVEIANALQPGQERGLSLQDIRQRLVLSGSFSLDYKNHLLLKNTTLATIITLESGRPYNLLTGVDLNLSGDIPPGDRPAQLGRNVGILPGFASFDMRLIRSVNFNDKVRLEAIAEAFNLFNRTNINEIDRIFSPNAQGGFALPRQKQGRYIAPAARYRGAFAPRQFQLGIKLSF